MANKTVAVLGAGHMGQSALRVLLRHRLDGGFRVFDRDTAHPEPLTLSRQFPRLRRIRCKGALKPDWANAAFCTLGRIGFDYHDLEVDVNGTPVQPAEFLWKLLSARYERRGRRGDEPVTAIQVISSAGAAVLASMTVVDHAMMARGTGLGATAAVDVLLSNGAPAGAHGVEVLDHAQALDTFIALAEDEHAFPDGIIATSAAAAAGGAR